MVVKRGRTSRRKEPRPVKASGTAVRKPTKAKTVSRHVAADPDRPPAALPIPRMTIYF
jgi:hypothetical protein